MYSILRYIGDGTNRNFPVTFPYLSREHVEVKVNGILSSFTWLTSSSIQLPVAPPSGAVVQVRRITPKSEKLIDFTDGSILTADMMDVSNNQLMYCVQELLDNDNDPQGIGGVGLSTQVITTVTVSGLSAEAVLLQSSGVKNYMILTVSSTNSFGGDLELFDGLPSEGRLLYQAKNILPSYKDTLPFFCPMVTNEVYVRVSRYSAGLPVDSTIQIFGVSYMPQS